MTKPTDPNAAGTAGEKGEYRPDEDDSGREGESYPTHVQLLLYMTKELPDSDLQQIEAHLAGCAACRQWISDTNTIAEDCRILVARGELKLETTTEQAAPDGTSEPPEQPDTGAVKRTDT